MVEGRNAGAFKDLTGLSFWTTAVLYIHILVTLLMAALRGIYFEFLWSSRHCCSRTVAENVWTLQMFKIMTHNLYLIQILTAVAATIVLLWWIYRVSVNVRRLGATGLRFTPVWSVGWFLVPVANLWKPYQILKELWTASANPLAWQQERAGGLVRWWPFLQITISTIGLISYFITTKYGSNAILLIVSLEILSNIVVFILVFIVISIVARIQELQMASYHAYA